MENYRLHPVFGILTDPDDIRIFDRQQEQEMYEKMYEEMYEEMLEDIRRQEYEEMYDEAMYFDYWMSLMYENEIITESI